MKRILALLASRLRVLGMGVCLVLLSSCAKTHYFASRPWFTAPIWFAHDSIRPPLPAETSLNKGAGRGDVIYLTLRLESGEELLFLADTGAPFTLLDKSLEPKLGRRSGTTIVGWLGGKGRGGVYRAPKLYLDRTELLTAPWVLTLDLTPLPLLPGRPVRGILGMDCLRHYCVHLDFESGKMRFLDPDHPGIEDPGKAFPLKISFGSVFTPENLVGVKGEKSEIDTGCNFDGTLKPKLLRQKRREQDLGGVDQIEQGPHRVIRGCAIFSDLLPRRLAIEPLVAEARQIQRFTQGGAQVDVVELILDRRAARGNPRSYVSICRVLRHHTVE